MGVSTSARCRACMRSFCAAAVRESALESRKVARRFWKLTQIWCVH
jgi:hypothetical protein